MRPPAPSPHSGLQPSYPCGRAQTGVGSEWGRAGAHHVPGVTRASRILIPRVYPEMCSSFTITCPTCGCCNHRPTCPSRTHSQQPYLWLPQARPSSMASPSAHSHLDEVIPRVPQHPLRGLIPIPSPSGVSDQPCA